MPIVRRVMEQLEGREIVATKESIESKFVYHDEQLVGFKNSDGVIEWLDTIKAKEAKLLIRSDKIKKIIKNDKC